VTPILCEVTVVEELEVLMHAEIKQGYTAMATDSCLSEENREFSYNFGNLTLLAYVYQADLWLSYDLTGGTIESRGTREL
jgi:hypothetical protein